MKLMSPETKAAIAWLKDNPRVKNVEAAKILGLASTRISTIRQKYLPKQVGTRRPNCRVVVRIPKDGDLIKFLSKLAVAAGGDVTPEDIALGILTDAMLDEKEAA